MTERRCTGPGGCDRPHKGLGLCNAHLNQYHARGKDRARLTVLGAARRTKGCAEADCQGRHYRAGRCLEHYEATLKRHQPHTTAKPSVAKRGNPGETYLQYRPPAPDELAAARRCLARFDALDLTDALGLQEQP